MKWQYTTYPPPAIEIGNLALEQCLLMNEFGRARVPFLFIVDFLLNQPIVLPLAAINPDLVKFDINGFTNQAEQKSERRLRSFRLSKKTPSFQEYKTAFDLVMENLHYGNSYLLNLTLPTRVKTNLTFDEIFYHSQAPYKLLYHNRFIVFSPELFVRICGNRIESHPMKGTIDASLPDAQRVLLDNPKETAEHNTIVDLIRNDLNRIALGVQVEKFRYITEVKTHSKKLLQVSTVITGVLPAEWQQHIGSILFSLLPAGSVSGAPKKKTVEIIQQAENYDRGYYTGVFGYFDGETLESAVMIRFIEDIGGQWWFKSGGGITTSSDCLEEYNELVDKVYLPFEKPKL